MPEHANSMNEGIHLCVEDSTPVVGVETLLGVYVQQHLHKHKQEEQLSESTNDVLTFQSLSVRAESASYLHLAALVTALESLQLAWRLQLACETDTNAQDTEMHNEKFAETTSRKTLREKMAFLTGEWADQRWSRAPRSDELSGPQIEGRPVQWAHNCACAGTRLTISMNIPHRTHESHQNSHGMVK